MFSHEWKGRGVSEHLEGRKRGRGAISFSDEEDTRIGEMLVLQKTTKLEGIQNYEHLEIMVLQQSENQESHF